MSGFDSLSKEYQRAINRYEDTYKPSADTPVFIVEGKDVRRFWVYVGVSPEDGELYELYQLLDETGTPLDVFIDMGRDEGENEYAMSSVAKLTTYAELFD